MRKIFITILTIALLAQCSKDESEDPVDVNAPVVFGISVDDIANNGNGSDLEITFGQVSDESLLSAYRIFVVRSDAASAFNLATAEGLSSDFYTTITPNGQDQKLTLSETATDTGGELITESVSYVVFVLSVADGQNATNNALSGSSNSITLAQTTIKITYIGNDGVHISDGEKAVIVDALPGNLDGWVTVASGVQDDIESGIDPYNNIKACMVTHNHADHYSTTSVNSFLQRNPSAIFLGPPQVVSSGIAGSTGQVQDLNLELDAETEVMADGIPIRILRIRHFNPQSGQDFASTTENYAFLIELGGKKILHIGDGDLSNVNFENLGLKDQGIDIILIPTFNFSNQLATSKRDVLINHIDPEYIIGLHLASATPVSDVTSLYPEAIVFSQSLQFVRL